ncbi:MAG TPA: hypothetical protein PLK12_15760 [Prolixibacteraceae bacterium]|nr:hypothetical protein [Prolixibacteraceae bacterium]
MKLSGLILENPSLLLMMEHLRAGYVVHEDSVEQVCAREGISLELFLTLCNTYNGFPPRLHPGFGGNEVCTLIRFLRNSHQYYRNEKYPEINNLIDRLFRQNGAPEIRLVDRFFHDYFQDVTEHLDYEDKTAFPAICFELGLEHATGPDQPPRNFTVAQYREHHTDIESNLSDMKNLLLKHIPLNGDEILRRKLLFSLFELEADLTIHSLIEEAILIPLVKKLENDRERQER